MAPRIDLNLEYEESEVVAAEENVMPEQTRVTTPESANDDEGIIPFRTSKRLQGTIYRMIQQRDGSRSHDNNNVPVTKDRNSGAPLSSRKVKRRLGSLSPEPIGVCKSEDKSPASADSVKDVGSRKRKTKRFAVHFADPLSTVIDDQKEAARRQPLSMSKGEEKARLCEEETPLKSAAKKSTQADGNRQQRPPPMSCFDLLCNHVGPRGWKCYRSCEEGKSFCKFHHSRKTLLFKHGIIQAVHI